MDGSKSPAKLGKPSQPRGTKPPCKEKTSKDGHAHTEEAVTTTRRHAAVSGAKEEPSAGKARGRTSRLTRLSGRTTLGEGGKAKAAGSHQQPVTDAPDSPGSYSTDSSPSTYRETGSPVAAGTTEEGRGVRGRGGGC